jgi:ABC-type dipeptide/oligopeptide/nickel transport system permease component
MGWPGAYDDWAVHCRFLLIVSLITFAMIHLIPGDRAVVIAVLSATPAQIANIRHDLGLAVC